MDAVLTGHDHFYYRSWPIGRLGDSPSRGIPHITTAGGGAPLYQLKARSYTATQKSVHHVTVLDFVGDRIDGQVVDLDGEVFDRFTITKDASPPAEFCAYEVYELQRAIRREIESRQPCIVAEDAREFTIDDELEVKHFFRVPVAARLTWIDRGVTNDDVAATLQLKPNEPLRIPIERQVKLPPLTARGSEGLAARLPTMKLKFLDDRFRNREIDFSPLKLWRDRTVHSKPVSAAPKTAESPTIREAPAPSSNSLVRSDGNGLATVPADVRVTHSDDKLIVTATVHDPTAKVADDEPAAPTTDAAALLKVQNVRVQFAGSEGLYSFMVTPDGRRADARDGKWESDAPNWSAVNRRVGDDWVIEITLPRKLLGGAAPFRFNFVHANPVADVEDCLSPTFDVGSDPDRNPDFRYGDRNLQRFARLVFE
jgi:hypothetical protein